MPEFHLRKPTFTCAASGPFFKQNERIKKFKETEDLNYIYQNELDKACFNHAAAYADSKRLVKRTVSDNILEGRPYETATDCKFVNMMNITEY